MARSQDFLNRLRKDVNPDKLNSAVEIWNRKNMYSNGSNQTGGGASTNIGGIYDNPRPDDSQDIQIDL